jgi:hypothetical protein
VLSFCILNHLTSFSNKFKSDQPNAGLEWLGKVDKPIKNR